MKKVLLSVLVLALMVPCAYAQVARGPLQNVFASWASVTSTATTFTPPNNSRDVTIHNGSAIDICVNLTGGAIPQGCVSASKVNPKIFQLNGTATVTLRDYVTSAVSIKSVAADASPVSVIITY